ncbi:MAG: gamma-glutamyl-gamma-aminobutyrate hydrolase family protein, partial [Flavisolibacter sp.]
MKKKIGISYCEYNFQNYWNWFNAEELSDDIELVELSFQKNNTEDIKVCDGFILTGGVDVTPSLYKESENYENAPSDFRTERDLFEKHIYEFSQENKLPLLGICRGMQLVNVLEGGKLIQDLGKANRVHKKQDTDKQHEIRIERQSLLFETTGLAIAKVNSAHHQVVRIDALGNNLKVNSWSETDDSAPEGLEFTDKKGKAFMLCVQWHPERMPDKEMNPASINIKKRFLKEIRLSS